MKSAHKVSHSPVYHYRERMYARGFRQIQIWVPNTKSPKFADECQRQSFLASKREVHDRDLAQFLENALNDIEGWKA